MNPYSCVGKWIIIKCVEVVWGPGTFWESFPSLVSAGTRYLKRKRQIKIGTCPKNNSDNGDYSLTIQNEPAFLRWKMDNHKLCGSCVGSH